jgi:hypothetical protein
MHTIGFILLAILLRSASMSVKVLPTDSTCLTLKLRSTWVCGTCITYGDQLVSNPNKKRAIRNVCKKPWSDSCLCSKFTTTRKTAELCRAHLCKEGFIFPYAQQNGQQVDTRAHVTLEEPPSKASGRNDSEGVKLTSSLDSVDPLDGSTDRCQRDGKSEASKGVPKKKRNHGKVHGSSDESVRPTADTNAGLTSPRENSSILMEQCVTAEERPAKKRLVADEADTKSVAEMVLPLYCTHCQKPMLVATSTRAMRQCTAY